MVLSNGLFKCFLSIKEAAVIKLKKIQVSIAQLDNYGPWTVTPESKPEAYLQMLQTRLFADLEEEFFDRGGLAFLTRFDNTLVVSNGVPLEDHRAIQKRIREDYPVTLTFGVGVGETAYKAQKQASQAIQNLGSSQSEYRREGLGGDTVSFPDDSLVQIAHIDINHATGLTDIEPIYDTHHLIQMVYLSLSELFSENNSLVFYTGGDNFMAPCNGLKKDEILDLISRVEDDLEIGLKAGVGRGSKASQAAHLASEGLHDIRDGKTEEKVILKESEGL